MVILPAIQRLLDVTAKWWGIHIVKKIQASDDVVIFPQGASGSISECVGTEFSDDDVLRRGFESQ